jgi:exosortase/archaeosortase family protein
MTRVLTGVVPRLGLGSPRAQLGLRTAALLGLVLAAYHYSLASLLGEVGAQTPLAYLGLVPVISLMLAVAYARRPRQDPDVHDRYLDYIVGVPLVGIALLIVIVAPALSGFFWLWRLDLLSLPFFVAGAVALIFGARILWRHRVPIAFLFLAWPLPYVVFLNGGLAAVTNATSALVRSGLRVIPVAQSLPGGDGSLFQVTHGGQPFLISVGSACSGVDSGVGFLLVGGAAVTLMRGPRLLKAAWLLTGTALLIAFDATRILFLLAAGRFWGQGVAINVLHPFVGVVGFVLCTAVMLLLLPRFRLRLDPMLLPARVRNQNPSSVRPPRPPAVRKARTALCLVAAAAMAAAVVNTGLSGYELLAYGTGEPRINAGGLTTATVAGWSQQRTATYPWVSTYFGTDATWERFVYIPGISSAKTHLGSAITVDVISTSQLGTFSTYTVDDCYRFHQFSILDARTTPLGGGLIGHVAAYYIHSDDQDWVAVYWEWPVRTASGDRYERVIFNAAEPHSGRSVVNSTEQTLEAFARRVVTAAAQQTVAVPGASA